MTTFSGRAILLEVGWKGALTAPWNAIKTILRHLVNIIGN
jgi:hypothetical protein